MSKIETQNNIKRHTEAKLEFYIAYLASYLSILFKTPHVDKINIYDMFCGQDIYDDGKESGAVRAFNKIKEVQNNNTEITLTLNDNNKRHIEKIKEWIKPQTKTFKTHIHNEDATALIKKLIKGINKQDNKTRNLVFIDPYGYKVIDKQLIEGLLESRKTEVIIFLPINQMNRFKGQTRGTNITKDFLPLKKFISQFGIDINSVDTDIDLINAIEKSFSFNDEYYATSYHIKNQQGKYYALFFITHHIYGLQKILEVKWELDKLHGSGFNDVKQSALCLEMESQEDFAVNLKQYLKESRNNNEIYEWTLKQGFLPKHTNKVLKQYQQNNQLKIKPKDTRKGSFYINNDYYKNNNIKINIQINL